MYSFVSLLQDKLITPCLVLLDPFLRSGFYNDKNIT